MAEVLPGRVDQGWEVPDVGFSQAQVAAALAVVETIARRVREPELIFLGGDRAVGLGHVNSGVDLYVVSGLAAAVDAAHVVDGTRVRVRTLHAGDVTDLLALATAYRATSTRSAQLAADDDRVRDLLRLLTGHRLVVAPRWAAELEAVSLDAVRQLLISRAALTFGACAEDVFGALLSGDLFTAVTQASSALGAACEAVLAAAGDFGCGGKFVFRRLARNPITAPWCAHLWRLLNGVLGGDAMPSPNRVRAVVEERLLVGNRLLAWCAIEGWDKQLEALPEPAARCGSVEVGPRRSAYFAPVRFANALTLLGPGQGYQTTEGVVRLWRRLDGSRSDEVARELAGSEPAVAGLSVVEVEAAVCALQRVGAVGFGTARPDGPELGRADGHDRPFACGAEPTPELALRRSARFGPSSLRGWARDGGH